MLGNFLFPSVLFCYMLGLSLFNWFYRCLTFFFPSELKENEFWSLLHHSCISFVIGIEFIFIMRKTLEMRGVFCVRNAGNSLSM